MATLETSPPEIKDQIFSHLWQEYFYALNLVSPALSGVAAVHLYRSPVFRTTYRFARFVSTVSHSRRYADMVWSFKLLKRLDEETCTGCLARWIEWKYKDTTLYAARTSLLQQFRKLGAQAGWDTHPERNQLLKMWYGTVAVGSIVQILVACRNLREVCLHMNAIESDYLVKSPAYPPEKLSSMVFASEVSRSWTHNSNEIEPISKGAIIQQLPSLLHLNRLHIRRASWFTTDDVENIILSCPGLTHVDFNESGEVMNSLRSNLNSIKKPQITDGSNFWATSGSREEIARKLSLIARQKALSIISNGG